MYQPAYSPAPPLEGLAFTAVKGLKKSMATNTYHKPEMKNDAVQEDYDALLLRVGRLQDRNAFAQLFGYYAPRVKSYLLKHGADDSTAEEIVQATFVTVWEKAQGYDAQKSAASTWIFTIARNKRIDMLRKQKFIEVNSDDPALENAAAEENDTYADPASVETLHAAIEKLPAEQAKLLRMAFFEDKSHQVISDETKLPLGTVKSRLRLAVDKLRLAMKRGSP